MGRRERLSVGGGVPARVRTDGRRCAQRASLHYSIVWARCVSGLDLFRTGRSCRQSVQAEIWAPPSCAPERTLPGVSSGRRPGEPQCVGQRQGGDGARHLPPGSPLRPALTPKVSSQRFRWFTFRVLLRKHTRPLGLTCAARERGPKCARGWPQAPRGAALACERFSPVAARRCPRKGARTAHRTQPQLTVLSAPHPLPPENRRPALSPPHSLILGSLQPFPSARSPSLPPSRTAAPLPVSLTRAFELQLEAEFSNTCNIP